MPEQDEQIAVYDDPDNLPYEVAELDNGLTALQNRAILAVISTPTLKQAAQEVGISRATLWRWMRDSDFRREYLEMRNRKFSAAVGRAQEMADGSMECLKNIIQNPKTPAASRVSAIRLGLDFASRGMELDNLDYRLASLEEHAAKNNHRP